jgi:cyanate permease
MPAASAGFVASFLHVYRTIGSIILPRASYYLRSKRLTIMSVLFIAGIAILTTGLSKGILLWVSIFFSGVTVGSLMPLLLLTLMDMPQVGAKYMGIAGGMFFSVGEIGGFLGPFLMGYLKDITGSFLTGLIFLSVVCEIMFVLAFCIKE